MATFGLNNNLNNNFQKSSNNTSADSQEHKETATMKNFDSYWNLFHDIDKMKSNSAMERIDGASSLVEKIIAMCA